jgi:hypothetical protein
VDEFALELILRYWRLFAVTALGLFFLASLTIFALPQNHTIRSTIQVGALVEPRIPPNSALPSSVEFGSSRGSDRLEPLEPPDQTAKRIQDVFLQDEIAALPDNVSASSNGATFQNLKVEAIGRTIVIQGSARESTVAA